MAKMFLKDAEPSVRPLSRIASLLAGVFSGSHQQHLHVWQGLNDRGSLGIRSVLSHGKRFRFAVRPEKELFWDGVVGEELN